jgi:hypothetical protein
MGLLKSLVEKVKGKKDELQKKAAKKAAKVAIDRSARAAKGALDSAGNAIERAIFGDVEEEAATEAPDPFAALKATEAKKKEDALEEKRHAKERTAKQARSELEVDAELAAMKKKLGK